MTQDSAGPRPQPAPFPDDVHMIPAQELLFDERNPRLQESGSPQSQDEILATLWREFAVDEVALSIAANGFFRHEPLFAERHDDRLVVIEGNRRLAAVRLLIDTSARQAVGATDLPRLSGADIRALETLPVVVVERAKIWQYVGFKHVNGPQQWRSYSKAEYIAWVHNELDVPLDEIASKIGDRHATVQRLYRALMAIRQAEQAGVYNIEDRWRSHFSFSHLYTGFDYSGIQKFIALPSQSYVADPVPARRLKELGELCEWLFGSRSKNKPPVVQSQNPDLRILDEVLQNRDGLAALRQGLPLGLSRDISQGDPKLFRESMVAAKHYLQEARGKLLTGYAGEPDLLETAGDIVALADSILQEMEARRTSTRRASRSAP